MANNVKGGAPNAIVAKTTVSFADAGINADNTDIIYLVEDPLKSFKPGRPINGISGFVAGKGYYAVFKIDMDLSEFVVPPVDGVVIPQLPDISAMTATPSSSTQINLTWNASSGATAYVVDRATNSGFTTGVTNGVYTGLVRSFSDTGRTASTHYYYRVRATAPGYLDSDYALSDATTSGTGPTLEDITFPTAVSLNNSGTTWNATDATGFYQGYGLSNKKLAAGQDGYIRTKYTGTDAVNAIFGFNASNTNERYIDSETGVYAFEAGAYVGALGVLIYLDNATAPAESGSTLSVGDYYRIIRTGSVIKLQKSVDGTTWTDAHTYAFSGTGNLFINTNIDANTGANKLYEPKGYNIS